MHPALTPLWFRKKRWRLALYNARSCHKRRSFHQRQCFLPQNLFTSTNVHGKRQQVRALSDEGSENSFISQSLVKKLQILTSPVNGTIHTVDGMQACSAKGRTTIELSSRINPRFSRSVDTLILPAVTSCQPSVQTVKADFTHLFGVHLAGSYEAFLTPVELFLGVNICWDSTREVVTYTCITPQFTELLYAMRAALTSVSLTAGIELSRNHLVVNDEESRIFANGDHIVFGITKIQLVALSPPIINSRSSSRESLELTRHQTRVHTS